MTKHVVAPMAFNNREARGKNNDNHNIMYGKKRAKMKGGIIWLLFYAIRLERELRVCIQWPGSSGSVQYQLCGNERIENEARRLRASPGPVALFQAQSGCSDLMTARRAVRL